MCPTGATCGTLLQDYGSSRCFTETMRNTALDFTVALCSKTPDLLAGCQKQVDVAGTNCALNPDYQPSDFQTCLAKTTVLPP